MRLPNHYRILRFSMRLLVVFFGLYALDPHIAHACPDGQKWVIKIERHQPSRFTWTYDPGETIHLHQTGTRCDTSEVVERLTHSHTLKIYIETISVQCQYSSGNAFSTSAVYTYLPDRNVERLQSVNTAIFDKKNKQYHILQITCE